MSTSFVPIYKKLFDQYKVRIINQEIRPGQKVDSITRMMQKYQVSRETAKLVLRLLTREKLVVSRAGMGTFVTPAVETRKIWGMVLPFFSSNMEHLINCLDHEARQRNREFVYFFGYNNVEEEERLVGTMILDGYEAVIVVPNNDESLTADFYRHLLLGNTRMVLIDNTMSGSGFRYVIQSYDLGVKRAVDYLVQKSRKNLLLVKNDTWRGRNMLYEFMEQTFVHSIKDNYPSRNACVISNLKDFSLTFIRENQIGGILCCTDTDAARVLGRLNKMGIPVPGEVSLVSYGNTELTALFNPPITVIDCDYENMARQTALLIEKGNHSGQFDQHVILPRLVIRHT